MKYLDWNIKCYCNIDSIVDLIVSKADKHQCIIALQEVMPKNVTKIIERMSEDFYIVYSLDYRPADDEFDTDNRRLGVMLLISKDYEVIDSGVFSRCLFPERTLYATIKDNGVERRVMTLHSITGVSFKMGKAVQFRSFAESIRDYKPDIISLDANEPKIDHYDIEQMEFFDQGDSGKGAKLFFDEILRNGLVDIYTKGYNTSLFKKGEPLITSHVLPNKEPRRYDFVFAKDNMEVRSVQCLYKEACEASSDHALIVATF